MNDFFEKIFDFLGKDGVLLSIFSVLITVIISLFTTYFKYLIEVKEERKYKRIITSKGTSGQVENVEVDLSIKNENDTYNNSKKELDGLDVDDENVEELIYQEDKNFNAKKDSLLYLKQQIHTDTVFKKVSFYLAVIMAITGTTILFGGSIACFFFKNDLAWITVFSGSLTDVIATVFFWLINKTAKEVRLNNRQLERIEDFFAGVNLIERIEDTEIKDKTYQETVYRLIESKDSTAKPTNEENK